MHIEHYTGPAIEPHWKELAELRIQVFREYPYLYEGSLEYEFAYLATYWNSPSSLLVLVRDGGRAVGACTSLPLQDEQPEFQEPFLRAGLDPAQYFYLGESVLLPDYRGQGLGNRFFDERERHARKLGFRRACFCAVERPPESSPPGYRPLHEFWRKRGYERQENLRTEYSWRDLGERESTSKPMVFWVRTL